MRCRRHGRLLNSIPRDAAKITVSVTVDLGLERGKPIGTIFQLVQDQPWKIPMALGSSQSFNHYNRSNPRVLHGYARRSEDEAFVVTQLGTATKIRYRVFTIDNVLIDGKNREYFDTITGEWAPLPNPWYGATFLAGEQINYAHWLGAAVFISTDQGIFYNGVRIVSSPTPSYGSGAGCHLFYNGKLFTHWPGQPVKVYNWQPGDPPVGSPATTFDPGAAHFLRAYGMDEVAVYFISAIGGVFRFDMATSAVTTISPSTPMEFYCLQSFMDNQFRLGHYPSGDQWLFVPGQSFEQLPNYPPEEAGASTSAARETQALLLYGGDVICPTWP